MAAEISIRGQVRNYAGSPIFMIKVSVYRGARLVEHGYTDDEGYYSLSLPAGEPVTVRFDTHPTLNNSRMWHPSVFANLEATKEIVLNRSLLKVGVYSEIGGAEADIDALAAYQFAVLFTSQGVDSGSEEYGREAAARLGQIKYTNDVLLMIQRTLIEYFESPR
jgi:hypothetical protein